MCVCAHMLLARIFVTLDFFFTCPSLFLVEVETPLNTAKKIIILSADMYDTEFSLQKYVSA